MELNRATHIKPKCVYGIVLFLFLAFLLSVFLNIAFARQVVGFIYLTLVPGFLIVRILRMNNLDSAGVIVFSMGFGVAFLMILGLLDNFLITSLGSTEPLSFLPLMIVLNGALLALFVFDYQRSKNPVIRESERPKPKPNTSKLLLFPIIGLPILSVIGGLSSSFFQDSNSIILALYFAVAIFTVLVICGDRFVPSKFYPLLLVCISLALLLATSLASSHLNGFDIHWEYRSMKAIVASSEWYPNVYDIYQPLMSVTILPAIYSEVLNIDGIWISKLIYPLIFSFVPLTLYKLYGVWTSKKTALLSALLIVFTSSFYTEIVVLNRQMIAELFFVLLLFTLFAKNISNFNRTFCFIIFGFALVASHYALAEIFLLVTVLAWIASLVIGKKQNRTSEIRPSLVAVYAVILLAWYTYLASGVTFDALSSKLRFILQNVLTEFLNPFSRGSTVLLGLGAGDSPATLVNLVGRSWAYVVEVLIVVGFVYMLVRKRRDFPKSYVLLTTMNMLLLALSIILPSFADSFGMTRLYHVVLLCVAPLFMLGIGAISAFLSTSRKEITISAITLLILVPFILFQTGAIYEVAQVDSYSVPLSKFRFDWSKYLSQGLIEQQDLAGIEWTANSRYGTATMKADSLAVTLVVVPYGTFSPNRIEPIEFNVTQINRNELAYFRHFNSFFNVMAGSNRHWEMTSYVDFALGDANRLYSNAGCEIYQNP